MILQVAAKNSHSVILLDTVVVSYLVYITALGEEGECMIDDFLDCEKSGKERAMSCHSINLVQRPQVPKWRG